MEKTTAKATNKATFGSKYTKLIQEALMEQHKFSSVMNVPRIEKIVINSCVSEAIADHKVLESVAQDLAAITGQKPIYTKAKHSIATFKLRENQPIGVKVTLRGEKMWTFIEKLLNIALPRVRDFNGLSNRSFDGRGNYTIGVKEQSMFVEVNADDIKKMRRGFDITIVTSTNSDDLARELLTSIGFPFAKKK